MSNDITSTRFEWKHEHITVTIEATMERQANGSLFDFVTFNSMHPPRHPLPGVCQGYFADRYRHNTLHSVDEAVDYFTLMMEDEIHSRQWKEFMDNERTRLLDEKRESHESETARSFNSLSYEDFVKNYRPIKNHLRCWEHHDYCAFETFEEEGEFVRKMNPSHVWTEVHNHDGEHEILPGIHFINRMAYLVTEEPWKHDNLSVPLD